MPPPIAMPIAPKSRTSPRRRTGFRGRQVFAHDHRIAHGDAAVSRPEQHRDQVEGEERIHQRVEDQRRRLDDREHEQSGEAADSVHHESPAREPHQCRRKQGDREHFGRTHGRMTQIAGVCDEVPERNRHGNAAREHGEAERSLQLGVGHAEAWRPAPRGRAPPLPSLQGDRPARQPPPQERRQGQRGEQHEDPEAQVGRPPARGLVEVAKDRRPDGPGNPLAGGEQSDRESPPVLEPAHHVDHQGADHRSLSEQAHHHPIDGVQLPLRIEHAGEQGAGPDHRHPESGYRPRPGTVEPVAHHDSADSGAQKETGVGKGRHAAGPAEVERDLLEPHHEHEHAAVGAQDEKDRYEQHDEAEARRGARIVFRRVEVGHVASP